MAECLKYGLVDGIGNRVALPLRQEAEPPAVRRVRLQGRIRRLRVIR